MTNIRSGLLGPRGGASQGPGVGFQGPRGQGIGFKGPRGSGVGLQGPKGSRGRGKIVLRIRIGLV